MVREAKKVESRSRVIKRPETVPPSPPRLFEVLDQDWQELYANISIISSISSASASLDTEAPIYDEVGIGPPKEIPGPSTSTPTTSSPSSPTSISEDPKSESAGSTRNSQNSIQTEGSPCAVHCPEDREIEIELHAKRDDLKCQEDLLEPEIYEEIQEKIHDETHNQTYKEIHKELHEELQKKIHAEIHEKLHDEIHEEQHEQTQDEIHEQIDGQLHEGNNSELRKETSNEDDVSNEINEINEHIHQESTLTNEPSISESVVAEGGNPTNLNGNAPISPQLSGGRIRTVDGITTIEIDPNSIFVNPRKDIELLRKKKQKGNRSSTFEKSYRISQAMASEFTTRKNPFTSAKEKLRLKRRSRDLHTGANEESDDKTSRRNGRSIITANVARVKRTVRRKMGSWYLRVKLPVESQIDKFQMNFFQESPVDVPDSSEPQGSAAQMCHEDAQRKGQNDFEDLRRLVKQGGDFCKDLAAVLQERSELEAQYAKGLSKLSAKLLKASKEATGSVAHAWQAVAVQTDTQAELHRIWSTALSEEVSRPLRNSIETQHKIRKSVESLVEKTTRNLAEWRTAESKSKRQCFTSSKEFEKLQESGIGGNSNSGNGNFNGAHLNNNANSAIVSRSRLLSSVPPMDKDPIKLEAKRRKAEEAVRRADIEYYTFCVRSERARLEWEGAVRNGSTCLRTLEEEKLGLLKELALKYFHYLSDLAPKLVLSTEALEEPVKSSSVDQDMHFLTDIRSHAGSEQLLPDFYAEDPSNLMKKERRKEALEKFVFLIRQDLDRERKGAAGVETLAKAIADSPKIDNAHHDISDRLYYMKSMLLYLEGSRTKLDNALADVEGRQRCSNAITQYMRHQRDKQGLPQTILKVPSWARDECLTSTVSSGVGSAGSSSPDWNDRGAADGNSHQINDDFDEFSSEGSSENIEVFDEEPLPPATKGVSNLISVPSIGKCKAIYDYEANMFDELTIRTGDEINIHDKQDDGWWLGEANGVIGIFPATYVEELSQDEPPGE